MQEATREELRNLVARYILEGGTWEKFRQVAKEEFGYRQGEVRGQLEKECGEFRQRVRNLLSCSWISAMACTYKDKAWVEELIVRAYIYRLNKSRYTIKQLAKETAEATGCNEKYIRENASDIVEAVVLQVAKHTNNILNFPYTTKSKNFIRNMNTLLNYFEEGMKIPS